MLSEKTEKMIVELKKEDRELLRSVIDGIEERAKVEPKPSVSDESHENKGHATIEELIACPDCYPKVRDSVLKKHREETKDSGLVCKECGLGVKKEWENCPSCGNKEAKER